MTTNLAAQLREGTTKSHSMAENVSFVKSFLGGVVDKNSYRKLLSNLYFVYDAIEQQMLINQAHPSINQIYFSELNRKQSLEQDLLYYYGHDWRKLVSPSPATQIYINRINSVGKDQPELLIAHAYTRYMGDLSGGQILKKIACSAMNLSKKQGVAFYDFDLIPDSKAFKSMYKRTLDNLPITDKQAKAIVSEANIAFSLNMKLFQELNSNIIRIMIMFLLNAINNFRRI